VRRYSSEGECAGGKGGGSEGKGCDGEEVAYGGEGRTEISGEGQEGLSAFVAAG